MFWPDFHFNPSAAVSTPYHGYIAKNRPFECYDLSIFLQRGSHIVISKRRSRLAKGSSLTDAKPIGRMYC